MVVSNPDGVVLVANPAYQRLCGLNRDEALGKRFEVMFPPGARADASSAYRAVFPGPDDPRSFRSVVLGSHGERRLVEVRGGGVSSDGEDTVGEFSKASFRQG